jgi:hypothetical protein
MTTGLTMRSGRIHSRRGTASGIGQELFEFGKQVIVPVE